MTGQIKDRTLLYSLADLLQIELHAEVKNGKTKVSGRGQFDLEDCPFSLNLEIRTAFQSQRAVIAVCKGPGHLRLVTAVTRSNPDCPRGLVAVVNAKNAGYRKLSTLTTLKAVISYVQDAGVACFALIEAADEEPQYQAIVKDDFIGYLSKC